MRLKFLVGAAALVVGLALILRHFYSFQLDAPPGLDAEVYANALAVSVVQTAISTPLTFLADKAETALIDKNPLKKDTLGPTVFGKKIGVPYSLELQQLTLSHDNGRLKAHAKLNTNLIVPKKLFSKEKKELCGPRFNTSAEIRPGVGFENKHVKEGALHGRVFLNFQVGEVTARIGGSCPGGRKSKLDAAIEEKILNPLLSVVTQLFRDKISSSLEEQINSEETAKPLNDALTNNVATAFQPFDLTELVRAKSPIPLPDDLNVFLKLNPQHAFIGPIRVRGNGRRAALILTPGVAAVPELHFAPQLPTQDIFLPLKKASSGKEFALNILGKVDLALAEQQASKIAKTLVNELLPDIRIGDLRIQLYQARERIVVGVHLRGVTWMRLRGSLFLTARPEFDQENYEVRLRDVKFDATSEGYLEKAAAWVLESPIEAALSDRLKLSLEPQFGGLLESLANITVNVDGKTMGDKAEGIKSVTLNSALADLTDPAIWLSENHLNVGITASGTTSLTVNH